MIASKSASSALPIYFTPFDRLDFCLPALEEVASLPSLTLYTFFCHFFTTLPISVYFSHHWIHSLWDSSYIHRHTIRLTFFAILPDYELHPPSRRQSPDLAWPYSQHHRKLWMALLAEGLSTFTMCVISSVSGSPKAGGGHTPNSAHSSNSDCASQKPTARPPPSPAMAHPALPPATQWLKTEVPTAPMLRMLASSSFLWDAGALLRMLSMSGACSRMMIKIGRSDGPRYKESLCLRANPHEWSVSLHNLLMDRWIRLSRTAWEHSRNPRRSELLACRRDHTRSFWCCTWHLRWDCFYWGSSEHYWTLLIMRQAEN